MANDTLNDIIVKVSAVVSQTTSVTDTSTEYGLWRSYVNMAQKEWAETYDWQVLFTEYNTMTSNASGNATIAMPGNFRKLSGYPKITDDGTNTHEYSLIDPQKKTMMGAGEFYSYLLHSAGGVNLIVNPGTLASGASIFVSYWKSPASLVSPANVVDCPNSDYLVQRTIAYVWESREDNRFPQAKAEADKILSRLLEMENTQGQAYDNKIIMNEERNFNFRLGRD